MQKIIGATATSTTRAILTALLLLGIFDGLGFALIIVTLTIPVGFHLTKGAWMPIAALSYVLLAVIALIQCWRKPTVTWFVALVAALPALTIVTNILGSLYRLFRS